MIFVATLIRQQNYLQFGSHSGILLLKKISYNQDWETGKSYKCATQIKSVNCFWSMFLVRCFRSKFPVLSACTGRQVIHWNLVVCGTRFRSSRNQQGKPCVCAFFFLLTKIKTFRGNLYSQKTTLYFRAEKTYRAWRLERREDLYWSFHCNGSLNLKFIPEYATRKLNNSMNSAYNSYDVALSIADN